MISVCLASYNGESYIREQIDSILSQLSRDDELIISDDSSLDNTVDIVKSYNDDRIKLISFVRDKSIYKKSSRLITTNFENALMYAKGEHIFLSDQDDIWLPGKVQMCLAALKQADLVVHDCIVVNSIKERLYDSYFDLIKIHGGFYSNFLKIKYLGCCMAFNRNILDAVLPMKPYIAHDTWFCLLSELLFKTARLPQQLVLYRRHENNMSTATETSCNPLWFKIYYRIPILLAVFTRYFKYKLG
ncbi:glycosyltransferase [Bacteroides sp. CACC 737]|uniref:glycosyltransferase n=1 Tax=Bacteroides TaxID=816 RepID=UPI0015EF80C8|nr:glycosyltransferase [Bacteroides sp. CACC 737]QMI80242.1 glycosyltransferase [Bacteroides sp. CACC 737]